MLDSVNLSVWNFGKEICNIVDYHLVIGFQSDREGSVKLH